MTIVWIIVEGLLILNLAIVVLLIRGMERRSRRDRAGNPPLTPYEN